MAKLINTEEAGTVAVIAITLEEAGLLHGGDYRPVLRDLLADAADSALDLMTGQPDAEPVRIVLELYPTDQAYEEA